MSTSCWFWFTPEIEARLLEAVVARFDAAVEVPDCVGRLCAEGADERLVERSGPVAEPATAAIACALVLSSVAVPMTLELLGPGAAAVAMSEGSDEIGRRDGDGGGRHGAGRVRRGRTLVDEDVRQNCPGVAPCDGRTRIAVRIHAVGLERVEVPGQSIGDSGKLGLISGQGRVHRREVSADRTTGLEGDA